MKNIFFEDKNFINLLSFAKTQGNNWVIAISGGADSVGLFLAIKEFILENFLQINLTLLVVNHRLRSEVVKELEFLKNLANFQSIKLEILEWRHDFDFKSNLYDEARKNRYQLMTNYCKSNNIKVLFVAHHLNDQIETFIMRVNRGAGVNGLSCIRNKIEMNGIYILRPFLEIQSSLIRKYLSEKNQIWIEDRANYKIQYERAELRSKNKIDISCGNNIAFLVKKMNLADEALNYYKDIEFQRSVIIEEEKICIISENFINMPIEIALRILKDIFKKNISGGERRVLFSELLDIREKIIELPNKENQNLSFANFNISYNNQCFILKKIN